MRTSSAYSTSGPKRERLRNSPLFPNLALTSLVRGLALAVGLALAAGLLATAPAERAGTGLVAAAAAAEKPADPGAFLVSLGERAVAQLTGGGIDDAERERRFRQLFNENFDVPAISRFVLGIHWRDASDAQKAAFGEVFEDYVVQRFLPLFADYSGETFVVERVRKDPAADDQFLVISSIAQLTGEPARVIWRVRQNAGSYRILDLRAEGVSLAITLRQEYASVIRQSGIDGLVEQLRSKIKAGAFAPR